MLLAVVLSRKRLFDALPPGRKPQSGPVIPQEGALESPCLSLYESVTGAIRSCSALALLLSVLICLCRRGRRGQIVVSARPTEENTVNGAYLDCVGHLINEVILQLQRPGATPSGNRLPSLR